MDEQTGTQAPHAIKLPRRFRRWQLILLCVVLFLSGTIVGAGTTSIVLWRSAQNFVQHPEQLPDLMTAHLTRLLGLTAEQQEAVREILATRQKNIEAIRGEATPRVVEELRAVREEVAAVLSADQAARWHQRFETVGRRWFPPMVSEP